MQFWFAYLLMIPHIVSGPVLKAHVNAPIMEGALRPIHSPALSHNKPAQQRKYSNNYNL